VPTIQKARDAGILVIALDTPLDPIDAADATFATDNFEAGRLIGEWAKGDARRRPRRMPRSLSRSRHQPADRRRAARPGLHAGLRHRREGPEPLRRRG
jgi:ABC-type sugar transport system substrate-binding protein